MSIHHGLLPLPRWVTTTIGVLLTTGLAVIGVGLVAIPPWLASLRPRSPASAGRAADQAAARWQRAAEHIARAKADAHVPSEAGAAGADRLLGAEWTPLVTTLGHLEAKRLTISPAWARVLTSELYRAGLKRGDVAAASFSGSFPSLNIAVMSACDALGVRLIAVSSVTASSWGADEPGFTWPEMEVRLVDAGLLRRATVAVSAGGDGDRALGLEEEGQRIARDIAVRTAQALDAELLVPPSFAEAVQRRLDAFDRERAGRPLAVFINVGGTEASLGHSTAILRLANGWIAPVPFDTSPERGLVARMAERGVRVLHLLNVRDLAARWGIL
jgi:poly-gamma-glutamate system protein